MAGGAFELFAPQELGTEAYKYLFILENEKSNPASINKTGNKGISLPAVTTLLSILSGST